MMILVMVNTNVRMSINDVNSGMTVPLNVKLSGAVEDGSFPKLHSAFR